MSPRSKAEAESDDTGEDTITTSTGEQTLRSDPLEDHPGDTITTSQGTANIGGGEAQAQLGTYTGEGDRDWTDVNNRIIAISGVNVANFGDIHYTEEGDITDEDIAKLDAQFEKAGADPGQGRQVALAAKQMGYGIKFTARKGK